MPIKLKNNASGFLATAISASDTGLVLQAGNGTAFPTLAATDYFYATLVSTGGTQEVVKVTARVGDTMTVVRAQEGSSAAGFAAGSRLEMRVTAGSIAGYVQDRVVSVLDFGAVGDGVTDDTAAIQAAVTAISSWQTLDGLGRTYKVTGTIALRANLTLVNFTFDFSAASNSGELLVASGSLGNEVTISGGLTAAQTTFVVADATGLSADDFVYIKSSDFWDNWDDFVIMAEIHRVKSVVGSTVTLYDPILYAMPTNAKLQKLTTLDNITLRNIQAIGSGVGAAGDQEGARFTYCRKLLLDNCVFTKFDDRGVRFTTCIDFAAVNSTFGQARKTGLSYGVSVSNASANGRITGNFFFDCRHGISLGGNGGPNRYITVDNNNFVECREAGMDAHTAADICVISNNTFQCDPTNAAADGILWRGANVTITGNYIQTSGRYGIYLLNNVTGAVSNYVVSANVLLKNKNAGVFLDKQHAGDVTGAVINNNVIQNAGVANDFGILVTTDSGYTNTFQALSISGNIITDITYRGVVVSVADAASTFRGIAITNNVIRATTFDRGIFLSAATDSAISNITITNNVVAGSFQYGIRCTNEEDIVVTGNNIKTAALGAVLLTATNNVNSNNLT